MKKRLMALCMAVVMIAVVFTVTGVKNDDNIKDVSYAQRNTYGESETVKTTAFTNRVDNFIGDKVDSASNVMGVVGDLSEMAGDIGGYVTIGSGGGLGDMGGIGDALGSVGDVVGGIFGGNGNNTPTQNNAGVTYSVIETNVGQIQLVPAATQNYGTVPATVTVPANPVQASSTSSLNTAETVDFAAVKNPYQKPTGELRGGDTGEGVKWMQWVFIYTRYGLRDDGITGVFDEDTIAVVKKLQKENNMTVDGIVNDAVIDKIELLYFQATYTQPTLAISTTSAVKLTSPVVVAEQDNTIVVLLFVIVVLAWILVIVFVGIMVAKNKKKKAQSKKVSEKTEENS